MPSCFMALRGIVVNHGRERNGERPSLVLALATLSFFHSCSSSPFKYGEERQLFLSVLVRRGRARMKKREPGESENWRRALPVSLCSPPLLRSLSLGEKEVSPILPYGGISGSSPPPIERWLWAVYPLCSSSPFSPSCSLIFRRLLFLTFLFLLPTEGGGGGRERGRCVRR